MSEVFLKHPLKRVTKETGEVVEVIESVTVTKLQTGALLNALDEAGERQGSLMRHLISQSTRLTHEQVNRLDLDDFAAISAEMERFLPSSLRIGGTASNSSQEPSASRPDGKAGEPSS